MRQSLLLCFLLLLLGPGAVSQENSRLRVGWRQLAPFQFLTERKGLSLLEGLDVEMVRAICQKARLPITFEEHPWAQQIKRIESGELDLVMSATRTPEREKFAHFSAPFRTETNVLHVRRSELYRLNFGRREDIIQSIFEGRFRVAMVEGFYHGPDLAALPKSATVVRTQSDVENFEALLNVEVDGLLIDQLQDSFISRQFGWDTLVAEYPVPIHYTEITRMLAIRWNWRSPLFRRS